MKKAVFIFMMLLLLFTGVLVTPVSCRATEQSTEEDEEKQDASDMVASDEERATQEKVGKDGLIPVYATDMKEGTYEIEVDSSSSMFRIVKAELTVEHGEMHAVLTLGGKGYLKLYMGTGLEAVEAPEEEYVPFVEDAEGAYTYEVPVEALNVELECTGFSKRKEKWYDHQIFFEADTLPAEALFIDITPMTEAEVSEEVIDKDFTEVESDSAEIMLEQQKIATEDGNYEAVVDMAGGSGRASITSPAQITITDGKATATIVWSSSNYDYMLVNGEKYLPVNTDGNSTFEIPVLVWNQDMSVIADTVAMGEPHEIEYTFLFHEDSLKALKDTQEMGTMKMVLFIVVLGAFVIFIVTWRKRKNSHV